MDKVSVILPVYNGEKYIKKCIDSVLNQTYKNIELVCINDGSTDNTLKIIKSIKDKRLVIIDKKNTGVSDSRNIGLSKSTGKYISFIDSDDTYDKSFIEKMYNYLIDNNVDIVRCNYKVINEDGNKIEEGFINEQLLGKLETDNIRKKLIPNLLDGSIPGFSWCLFIKKEIIKNILFPIDIPMMEDVVFALEVFLKINSIYISNEKLYNVTFNLSSATNNKKNYERNIISTINVNNYIKNILINNHLDSVENISNLNYSHCNAVSDFLFKSYLYNHKEGIYLMESINIENIFKGSKINNINLSRRILLKLIVSKKWFLLRIFCFIRKIIHNLKKIIGR